MHLLTFLKLKDPGLLFRTVVLGAQGVFCNVFFLTYLISPNYCHRLVGYLEVRTPARPALRAGELRTVQLSIINCTPPAAALLRCSWLRVSQPRPPLIVMSPQRDTSTGAA